MDLPETNEPPGPTDKSLRLLAGMTFGGGLLLLAANHAKYRMDGQFYPLALVLGPLATTLGLAGLISPTTFWLTWLNSDE